MTLLPPQFTAALLVTLAVLGGCRNVGNDTPAGVPDSLARVEDTSSVSGGSAPPEPGDVTEPPPLTAEGWRPLRIGMSRGEVVEAMGEDARPEAVGGPDPGSCDEFQPANAPEGLLVMVEQGVLTRISISGPATVRTDQGFGIGDTATEVKQAYGSAAMSSPHKYLASPAEYITAWSTGGAGPESRGIVYEIGGDGRVMHIHAGGPSIQYVEGCL